MKITKNHDKCTFLTKEDFFYFIISFFCLLKNKQNNFSTAIEQENLKAVNNKYKLIKLDVVGPADNRASINKFYHFVKKNEISHVKPEM